MSAAVNPVVLPGSLRATAQPDLAVSRLLLRPWRPDDDGDVAAVLAAFADPEIQRWGMRDVSSPAQARAWMRRWATGWWDETDACWAVVTDGVVVGRAAMRRLDLAGGVGELTYWVLPDARGRGIASAAAGEVARWALEQVGLRRVELWHSVHNEASCAVARRIGFPLEKTLRDGVLLVDGWHDVHRHAR
ncbi:GNAT family N-acetyltransferase [Pengzhenrongella phosphoraccumulans]|uniref:GNAT family N-acetyltransferase n=1 Tax=Pengzhenrongella phosphoraccumulans TaxID=3114394 RepID=UPI00388F7666